MTEEFTQITIYLETGRVVGLGKVGYQDLEVGDLEDLLSMHEERRAIWWLRGFGTCLLVVLVAAGCFGAVQYNTTHDRQALAAQELPTIQTFGKQQ